MHALYEISLFLVFSLAAIVFLILLFISAPYGKFLRTGWGRSIKAKWAWMIMESFSPALIAFFFITSGSRSLVLVIFFCAWMMHYLHRSFVYPFIQSGKNKPYPQIVVLMAILFNCLNGFINGYGIFHLASYDNRWLTSWQFIVGILLFAAGFMINKTAERKLRDFRKKNPSDYVVPHGWLFDHISSPHYFGEIIEWTGWAIMTWSLPGVAFAIFTFANLFPRAIASHKWYRSKFPGYPENRKAIIPFII